MNSINRYLFAAALASAAALPCSAQTLSAWPKWHLDAANTGWNASESVLTPANVNTASFGKTWDVAVDGQVYAEPLYVAKVRMGHGTTKALVFVATEHDSIYALDAATGAVQWRTSLGTSVPTGVVGCGDLSPEYGVTSTPVIDAKSGILYVCAKTLEGSQQVWRLHALDIATGAERSGWGFVVTGYYPSTTGGLVGFMPNIQLSRSGLVLVGRNIYVTFGSHCDINLNQYHGWIFAYDTRRPSDPPVIWNSSPDASGAREAANGIWMAGASPAVDDAGHLFVITGNGAFDVDLGGLGVGDTFAELATNRGRSLSFSGLETDYFTPSNQDFLRSVDADLGSGGLMLVPTQSGTSTPDLLIGGGKDALLRVLDRSNLGGFTGRVDPNAPNDVVQEVGGFAGGFWSTPAYYGSAGGNFVYASGIFDSLKQFRIGVAPSGKSQLTLVATAPVGASYPSMTPVVSSNGGANGVLWVLNRATNALHALNASNVATELWNSNMTAGPDTFGSVIKFSVPTVANGQVFVGADGRVAAFGLR